eukprot:2309579-Ditylum_brightwellii.AAC.1
MHPSRLNPRLSAEAQMNGAFDFNRMPLALPVTWVIVHEKPKVCKSWAAHGVDGWYVGPAPHQYHCYRCRITTTNRDRIADTVEFFPKYVNMPAT